MIAWVQSLLALVSFVCFVLLLVAIVRRRRTEVAIACLVLLICGGIGYVVAFIYGWIHARQLRAERLMMVWTVTLALLGLISLAGVLA